MGKFEGKIALVTDGTSGIGLAAAQKFVNEGAYVYITGRRQNELDKAVNQIGKNVTGVQGDISKLEDLDKLYDIIKQEKGKLDILFANAGTGNFLPLGFVYKFLCCSKTNPTCSTRYKRYFTFKFTHT